MSSRSLIRSIWLLGAGIAVGVLIAGLAFGTREVLLRTGKTPTEFLDYADRRMEGHPKVETVARPVMGLLREAFDAEPLASRIARPFEVPPPPPRRGASDIDPYPPPAPGTTVWRVGGGHEIASISEVARRARDGDIVEIEAGDYYADTASWSQRRLTIRGVNGAARLFAAGKVAEGKAIWVFKHGDFDVANVDFIGAKASDRNGAGIRLERGRLRIRDCLFWGNEMGLLTAGLPYANDTQLEIENSEFAYSHVQGRWGHNLYVGRIDRLRVTGSYFHHASRGHLLKSRAAVNEILYSRFTDEIGGRASYELDFPNGGQVELVGNIVQQQALTENGVMLAIGEEGNLWPRNSLRMSNNTFVNDLPIGGAFVRAAAGLQSFQASNNLLVGQGRYLVPEGALVFNDQRAEWTDLAQPSRLDYRLRARNGRFAYQPLPHEADRSPDAEFVPKAQYLHPTKTLALRSLPQVVGADQRPAP